MLRALDIRDILIIDRLELGFQPGLNVLTGETGAGKSILLDALGFVLGWRGRAELVRQGADQGEVLAEFDLAEGHPARAVLEEAGLPVDDTLILRRVNARDGRKTAFVNDRRCSGEVLRALSDTLVELHGQQDDRGLLNPRNHLVLLDSFAGLDGARDKVRGAWRAWREVEKTRAAAQEAIAKAREDEEFLRHAVAELDQLAPEPGEDAELDARRRMMQGAERIREDLGKAQAALGTDGAEGSAGDALRWLETIAETAEGGLDDAIAALGRAMVELDEAAGHVTRFADMLSFNPHELEEAEERLFAIRGLARKHGVQPDDLAGFGDLMREKLAVVDRSDADLAEAEAAVAEARAAFDTAAEALSAKRAKAAGKLDKAMMAELAPLKLDRAQFETQVSASEPGPDGADSVTFTVATNPGAPAGPLNKIASGGELSRFLLALKVCLTDQAGGITMIFDEIDRGVGGATADAVGRRLAQLADQSQVLVVTHSPQVAAQGAHHWQVAKRVEKGATLSTVTPLIGPARVDEIARMLSGDTISDEARAAAEKLMTG
ncbi:MAG: DNA repair protein RecN [Pseudomonadota bacterium]